MRHSVQTDMLELVTDTHRDDLDQLTIADLFGETADEGIHGPECSCDTPGCTGGPNR